MTSNELLVRLAAYFAERRPHLPARRSERPPGVEVRHDWPATPFSSFARLAPGGVAYESIAVERAPRERRGALAHYIARVNFHLFACAFVIDWSTGGVCCRGAIDLGGQYLSDELLDGLVSRNHQAMIDWYAHLLAVVSGEMSPDEAFDEAVRELG